jgi:serine/threonine protein phosphatase PrpC
MAAAPQDEASRVTLDAWLVTDVGVVREHNEDSAYMEPTNGFFIVADGMGGHAAGEVASAMAVETVRLTLESARKEIDTFKRAPTDAGRRGIVQLLQSAVLSAHQAVFQRGQHEADKAGMGTTLDVVLIAGPEAFVAHVGDSRTYLVRDGRSSQITTDHTVAEVLVIEGKLTIEEAQVSPLRTILVNAIGVSADVGVEMAHVTLKRGDRLLLCSDGLHDYFPVEEEIAQKLSTDAPGDALKDMVELAKTRGGHDNITGVAVQVTEVIEAVPDRIDREMTQPVDLPGGNPFASDEPTETAVLDAAGTPRIGGEGTDEGPGEGTEAKPSGAAGDIGAEPTIDAPLPDEGTDTAHGATSPGGDGHDPGDPDDPDNPNTITGQGRATQPMRPIPDGDPPDGAAKAKAGSATPPGTKPAAELAGDALSDATLDTEPVASGADAGEPAGDARGDGTDNGAQPPSRAEGGDATPADLGTADTGRARAHEKQNKKT